MTTATAARAKHQGRKAAESDTVEWLARLGLFARGALYIVVGLLAFGVARGGAEQADKQGALRTIARLPLGRWSLLFVAAGFAGYALWRFAEATVRPGDKGVGGRVFSAIRGLLYTGFCVTTLSFVLTKDSTNSDAKERGYTQRVLDWGTPGRLLVAAVGLGLIATGLWNAWRALSDRYRKHLKEGEIPRRTLRWLKPFAYAGLAARAVAFSLVGAFFIQAAVTYDPDKARGLDDSLRAVARAPWGEAMIVLVAIGLVAFGLWCFVEARYREVLGS
jgi:hypothetical protein